MCTSTVAATTERVCAYLAVGRHSGHKPGRHHAAALLRLGVGRVRERGVRGGCAVLGIEARPGRLGDDELAGGVVGAVGVLDDERVDARVLGLRALDLHAHDALGLVVVARVALGHDQRQVVLVPGGLAEHILGFRKGVVGSIPIGMESEFMWGGDTRGDCVLDNRLNSGKG